MTWNEDRELIMAEMLLKATREGCSLEQGLQGVSERLGIEVKECMSHWDKHMKQRFQTAMQLAEKFHLMNRMKVKPKEVKETKSKKKTKKVVKQKQEVKKRSKQTAKTTRKKKEMTMQDVIGYLQSIEKDMSAINENKVLKKENKALLEKVKQLEAKYAEIRRDYDVMITILQKAQGMMQTG